MRARTILIQLTSETLCLLNYIDEIHINPEFRYRRYIKTAALVGGCDASMKRDILPINVCRPFRLYRLSRAP